MAPANLRKGRPASSGMFPVFPTVFLELGTLVGLGSRINTRFFRSVPTVPSVPTGLRACGAFVFASE